jgi:hypothetical protein
VFSAELKTTKEPATPHCAQKKKKKKKAQKAVQNPVATRKTTNVDAANADRD